MEYFQNIANKNFVLINREKSIPSCFQESQWRAILRAASTEEENYARDNSISLVNAKENPTTEEHETLAALCVWENNVKGTTFLHSTKCFSI